MQKILIVDDMPDYIVLFSELLSRNGYEVYVAQNGAEALAMARSVRPDLIVSDIFMPVMDGYTLCRELRADDQLRSVPFIFYSATFTGEQDRVLGLELGADRFVVKPQDGTVMLGIIRELLGAAPPVHTPQHSSLQEGGSPDVNRQYSEALFRKLEKKMIDLEKVNRELEQYIHEQKLLEDQLRHAQKMEAVGQFSAGVAHDFNNILTVIIGFGDLMRLELPESASEREYLGHIMAAAERAQSLTASLLSFSRRQDADLAPMDLNATVDRIMKFLQRAIGPDVTMIFSQKEGCVPVMADSGQLEQILMNLAINARDAMPAGGVLTIGTDIVTIDERFVQMHGYGSPGHYAVMSVADTGIGMDEATRHRVFDPFFTTKPAGRGTGLGLAIVYGIIQQHGGFVNIYSEPGQGTTFTVMLPLLHDESTLENSVVDGTPLPGGHETILVVEDESSIRAYLELFLAGLGYQVVGAASSQEAIELYRERSGEIGLVLMDLIMPIRSAMETALALRTIQSDVKILFTSGYPKDLIYERRLLDRNEDLLMKPLTPTAVAVKLRELIDRVAPAPSG